LFLNSINSSEPIFPFPFKESGHTGSYFEEYIMATIVIKDLSENIDLDRQAMVAITGGARTRGRQSYAGRQLAGRPALGNTRIVDFPVGYASGTPSAGRTTLK
jgi:hypothetical protein